MARKQKRELPDLPGWDAGPGEHLDFVNRALNRSTEYIARCRKHGATIVLVFESGREHRMPVTAHLHGQGLSRQLALYDGQVCPAYSAPQWLIVFASLIKAADVVEDDPEGRGTIRELGGLLRRMMFGNDQPPLVRPDAQDHTSPENRKRAFYRALRDFQTVNLVRSGHPRERLYVPLLWTHEADYNDRITHELWIPGGAPSEWLNAHHKPMGHGELRAILHQYGAQHERFQHRDPQGREERARCSVWILPVPWEVVEVDLIGYAMANYYRNGTD